MLAILVVLASPLLRTCSNYADHWNDAEYFARLTLTESLLGFVLNGYFPLLPWVFFPVMGFALGTYFFGDSTGQRSRGWRMPVCASLLLALIALGVLFGDNIPAAFREHYATEITFYPASTTFLLGVLGLNMLSLWALHRWADGKAKGGQERLPNLQTSCGAGTVLSFCRRYSIFAFTAYVVHHAAHLWPLWICEYLEELRYREALSFLGASIAGVMALPMADRPFLAASALIAGRPHRNSLWQHAVSTPMALVLAVVFVVLFYGFLVFMERRKRYSLEGLMRWVCE